VMGSREEEFGYDWIGLDWIGLGLGFGVREHGNISGR
jgi:hypothetical protein